MVQPSNRRLVTEAALAAFQAPQDALIANHETRVDDLETLAGIAPGDVSDATVRALITNPSSNTAQALYSGIPVSAGNAPYSADPTGVVDATSALIAAEAATVARGSNARLYIPAGTYKISGEINFRCGLDAEGATFNYAGTGTAVSVGSKTAGSVTFRRTFNLPRVINTSRGTTGWDGTSIGVKAYNLNDCTMTVPFIQDFEYGLVLMGNDAGFAYNKITLGTLWENHKQQVLDCTNLGYINENKFYGGRWQRSLTKGAVLDDVNAAEILALGQNLEGGPNNNVWYSPCLEGPSVAYYRVHINGSHNAIIWGRWESPGNAAIRVRWGAASVSNVLFYGYGLVNVVETFDKTDGTISPSIRYDSAGLYLNPTTTTAGQPIPHNVTTDINTWPASPTMRGMSYNSATGEFTPRPGRWRIYAKVQFAINGTGRRQAFLIGGGTNLDDAELQPSATNRGTMHMTGVRRFNGSETFKVQVSQTSGADLALETSSGRVRISADYLGN